MFIKITTAIFIISTILFTVYSKKIWKDKVYQWINRGNKIKLKSYDIISVLEPIFILYLCFNRYLLIGISMFILSLITSLLIFPYIKNANEYNKSVRNIYIINMICSVIIYSLIFVI